MIWAPGQASNGLPDGLLGKANALVHAHRDECSEFIRPAMVIVGEVQVPH